MPSAALSRIPAKVEYMWANPVCIALHTKICGEHDAAPPALSGVAALPAFSAAASERVERLEALAETQQRYQELQKEHASLRRKYAKLKQRAPARLELLQPGETAEEEVLSPISPSSASGGSH